MLTLLAVTNKAGLLTVALWQELILKNIFWFYLHMPSTCWFLNPAICSPWVIFCGCGVQLSLVDFFFFFLRRIWRLYFWDAYLFPVQLTNNIFVTISAESGIDEPGSKPSQVLKLEITPLFFLRSHKYSQMIKKKTGEP